MKVGVMGVGVVGGELAKTFNDPILYDPPKKLLGDLNKTDVIFVCVPTPFTGTFDDTYIKQAFNHLETLDEKIVVIKSTVLPGTTDKLQENSKHKIIFSPEFIRELHVKEDTVNPERQIVGYTKKSKNVAGIALGLLPKAPYKKVMKAKEAELVKYMGNCFLALKVAFCNQIYDYAKSKGIDYEPVKEAVSYDSRIGKTHMEISEDGYRGYGGACFPKDMKSFILESNLSILKEADKYNDTFGDNSKHGLHSNNGGQGQT